MPTNNLSTAPTLLPNWESAASWETEIEGALTEPVPALSNLKITRVHYLLAQALGRVVGLDSGANYHSWAVWGSRKAGATVRQEDLDSALRDATVVSTIAGAIAGLAVDLTALAITGWPLFLLPIGPFVGAVSGALVGRAGATWSRAGASREVLIGNRIVLAEIGRVSARYIELFHADRLPHPERLAIFIDTLRPGASQDGGQDLLRQAFLCYDRVRTDPDFSVRQEAAYFANCLAVLHEHIRLQPYIVRAMPFIVRRCVTERQMTFDVGAHMLAVSHDVPPLGPDIFP